MSEPLGRLGTGIRPVHKRITLPLVRLNLNRWCQQTISPPQSAAVVVSTYERVTFQQLSLRCNVSRMIDPADALPAGYLFTSSGCGERGFPRFRIDARQTADELMRKL